MRSRRAAASTTLPEVTTDGPGAHAVDAWLVTSTGPASSDAEVGAALADVVAEVTTAASPDAFVCAFSHAFRLHPSAARATIHVHRRALDLLAMTTSPSHLTPRPRPTTTWNARRPLAILLSSAVVAASFPAGPAWADVALPPPKPASGGSPSLPPPPPPKRKAPAKSEAKEPAREAPASSKSGGGGGGGGASSRSSDRTTAIVLLAVGGVVAVGGTTMLLVGAGVRPDGKTKGGQTSLLVAGAVTTTIGLGVAAIGLVLLLRSNNGRMPPIKSLTSDAHPAMRAPAWLGEAPATPAATSPFTLPLASGTF